MIWVILLEHNQMHASNGLPEHKAHKNNIITLLWAILYSNDTLIGEHEIVCMYYLVTCYSNLISLFLF